MYSSFDSYTTDPTEKPLLEEKGPLSPEQAGAPRPSIIITGRWPNGPETLPRRSLLKRNIVLFLDLVAALSPIAFLILAWMAFRLDGQVISLWGDTLTRAAKLGTTLYPILFATVLGRAMKSIARWRAEKGSTFSVLELLMGSQTLGSTIVTQISTLGSATPLALGFGLVVLWLLSPLGGASFFKLAFYRSTLSFYYSPELIYGALYLSSLLSPLSFQYSSMDSWGNIKIPSLESLDPLAIDDDGWTPVGTENVTYSSLIGIPVAGIPTVGIPDKAFSNFTLESTYFVFDCQGPSNIAKSSSELEGMLGHLDSNFSQAFEVSTFFLDTITPLQRNQTPDITPRYIIFGSKCSPLCGEDSLAIGNCSVTQSYVESFVECDRWNCAVTKVRRSRLQHPPASYTGLDTEYNMDSISSYWPKQGRFGYLLDQRLSTLTERFIYDPSKAFSANPSNDDENPDKRYVVDLSILSKEDFTTRFSLLFNTYWIAALAPQYLSGDLPMDPQKLNISTNQSSSDYDWASPINLSFAARESNATLLEYEIQYVCNILWVWVLAGTTSTLLIVSMVGTFLRWLCIGPDILGYVSSLARDNPYIPLPPGGCALDGSERAKLVASIKVRLVDVKGGDDIGHIAFSSLPVGSHEARKLRKDRPYM